MVDRRALRNALYTGVIVSLGYLLPFFGEHLSGPRGVAETARFLVGHDYFHYYLTCLALTVAVGVWVWYRIETRRPATAYELVGVGYGLVAGVTFAVVYVLLGTLAYSFALQPIYVVILVAIGVVSGAVVGVLRANGLAYE